MNTVNVWEMLPRIAIVYTMNKLKEIKSAYSSESFFTEAQYSEHRGMCAEAYREIARLQHRIETNGSKFMLICYDKVGSDDAVIPYPEPGDTFKVSGYVNSDASVFTISKVTETMYGVVFWNASNEGYLVRNWVQVTDMENTLCYEVQGEPFDNIASIEQWQIMDPIPDTFPRGAYHEHAMERIPDPKVGDYAEWIEDGELVHLRINKVFSVENVDSKLPPHLYIGISGTWYVIGISTFRHDPETGKMIFNFTLGETIQWVRTSAFIGSFLP